MSDTNRRDFLADVGRGMLIAGLGSTLAADMGLASARAAEDVKQLSFGKLEPLVALMQETPAAKLLPVLVEKLNGGTELKTLVCAGALANARTFGGEDYIGFHTLMALAPAYEMARQLPRDEAALPVLKVLYRNSNRIQEKGGRKHEVLHPVEAVDGTKEARTGEALREATRKADVNLAERRFAAMVKDAPGEAYNHLQFAVQDEVDVHRVVLAWRAWSLLDLTGKEQAHTLLRQSVRYCVHAEQGYLARKRPPSPIRTLLPKLFDAHKLAGREIGTRRADDAWVAKLSEVLFGTDRAKAAEAVAAALAEGFSPESVGAALSLASNHLLLRDPGRPEAWASPGKPAGSCHGDSIGVHASDAANAWRNIAKVSNARNTFASLIVGAYHTAGQSGMMGKSLHPRPELVEKVTAKEPGRLLAELEGAIKEKDQARAAAIVYRYGQLGHAAKGVFGTLLRYAISEDGALHAEKYWQTVQEEYAGDRPAFRWRQVVALARVTASEYGYPAPGRDEARRLLKV